MRGLLLAFIIAVLATGVSAQNSGLDPDLGNPGLGGKNIIQGRIFYPSGKPLDRRVRVRVSSVRGGPSSLSTDDNGAFMIQRLTDGTYELSVDAGPEYEPANESVQIVGGAVRSSQGQTVFVQITLKPKGSASNPPGVVNAMLAGVPKPAVSLYQQAIESSQAGNHKKAVEQLKQSLELAPQFALALSELGMQYLQLNQLDHAAESLRKAVEIAPEAFLPRLNRGLVLLQQKKFAEADGELKIALARNDSSALAHEYRGRALIGLGRLDEAEKELRRAVELGGDLAANAHRYLGALYMQRGQDDRAIVELREYLRLQPNVKDAQQIKQILKDLGAKDQ